MRKKRNIWIFPFILMGMLLMLTTSCKKDDDSNNNSNPTGQIPVLATTAVSNITQTAASCGGNITSDGGSTVTDRGVCWSTNQTPTIADSKTTDGTGAGSFVSSISGLSANTTYYVRAYATNSNGTGYGSAMSFTTENGGSGGNIPVLSTTAVTDITQTTANSGGNITSDGGATVTARGVCWSIGQTPTISDNKTTDGTGAGNFASNINGLTANTTYFVRAYATNSNGTGYGSAMSFITEDGGSAGSFTDPRDGNVYQTVTIGNQVWMAENLKYLPSVVGPGTGSATTPYYYVYDYTGTNVTDAKATSNYSTYGVLYNWTAAYTSCPAGWHLPSDAEWTELTDYLGSDAGGKLKETGTTHWNSPNTGATNETGFTARPGGNRGGAGAFGAIGIRGYWWSATELSATDALYRGMKNNGSDVERGNDDKEIGFCVRCVRD